MSAGARQRLERGDVRRAGELRVTIVLDTSGPRGDDGGGRRLGRPAVGLGPGGLAEGQRACGERGGVAVRQPEPSALDRRMTST